MKIARSVIVGFCLVLFTSIYADATSADPVTGLWYTQDREGGVELYSCGKQICGRLYWLKDDMENGDVSRDTRNSDPEKRSRPLCRMQFMSGFVPDGKGHYTDGLIYSPRHGADFNAQMTLVDHDTLDLRGYIFFPFLGQTQTWKRAETMPGCKAETDK